MSTTTETPVNEIEVLRKTNVTLLQKSRDRKAKITEHEATIADLQSRLSAASTALHDATVAQPLRKMAETLSPVPELWLAEFAKHFKVELKDGKLAVLTAKGEPATDGDKPVEFDAPSLIKLLTGSENEELASFAFITRGSLASGGNASQHTATSSFPYPERVQEKTSARPQFGLR